MWFNTYTFVTTLTRHSRGFKFAHKYIILQLFYLCHFIELLRCILAKTRSADISKIEQINPCIILCVPLYVVWVRPSVLWDFLDIPVQFLYLLIATFQVSLSLPSKLLLHQKPYIGSWWCRHCKMFLTNINYFVFVWLSVCTNSITKITFFWFDFHMFILP